MIKKSEFQIKDIPLLLVYILYPIVNISCRLTNIQLFNNWIDVIWAMLLSISILNILLRPRFTINRLVIVLIMLVIIFIYLHISLNLVFNQIEAIPLFMELKPFFYILFGWIWIKAWGIPDEKKFIIWGAWLGLILIVDLIVESSINHRIVKIMGSGEINYDACLLVISSCFFIANKSLASKKNFVKIGLIFLGLLASLSRTGLIIEVLIFIIFWQSSLVIKLIPSATAMAAVVVSFLVRNLPLSLLSGDRYWMWRTATILFLNHPIQFLLGFGVQTLPVIIPPQLSYLWVELQQTGWGLSGIYAYNFHSFWLRFISSWGLLATLPLILLLGYFLVSRNCPRLLRLLSLVFIMEGVTMGVIYLGNVAVPLLIAIYIGIEKRRILISKMRPEVN